MSIAPWPPPSARGHEPSIPVSLPPVHPRPGPGLPAEPVRRFTTQEYDAMVAAGVISDDEPVELLDGWVVPKMPRDPVHDGTLSAIAQVLGAAVGTAWHVRVQSALVTPDSVVEPDAVVARGKPQDFMARHPSAADVGLVIEVANTSLARDRGLKREIYARAGIPGYWIVDLVTGRIEVHSDPGGTGDSPAYREVQVHGKAARLAITLPGQAPVVISVGDLLP